MGGVLASGRWHTMPKPVVYCADHPSTALLEVFVHLGVDPEDVPAGYRLLTIETPGTLASTRIEEADLTEGWRADVEQTRCLGDAWLVSASTALLDVPGAVAPRSRIIVVNASHAEAASLKIVNDDPVVFDGRLWK